MKNDVLISIRQQLSHMADPEIAQSGQRYFKHPIKTYGIKTAEVIKLGKAEFKHIASLPKTDIFDLCDSLWQSGYMEESFIACDWSYAVRKQYKPADIDRFEGWIKQYVDNWASCDTLCNHSVGTLVDTYPELIARLKTWATTSHPWLKRAAAVSLIIPARRGKFLTDIFEIADILLLDDEDLVQKGYGWMLKAASQAHPQAVFDYVQQHKQTMPRTALRYAIEKLTPTMKQQAMKK